MRRQELQANIFAVRLTPETLGIIEKLCSGSIKGTKLPKEQRCIDFQDPFMGEIRIEMFSWLVQFRKGTEVINQVWDDKRVKLFLKDIDDVAY